MNNSDATKPSPTTCGPSSHITTVASGSIIGSSSTFTTIIQHNQNDPELATGPDSGDINSVALHSIPKPPQALLLLGIGTHAVVYSCPSDAAAPTPAADTGESGNAASVDMLSHIHATASHVASGERSGLAQSSQTVNMGALTGAGGFASTVSALQTASTRSPTKGES